MRNIAIGIIVLSTIAFGIYTIIDYNSEPETVVAETTGTDTEPFVRDDIGEKYNIDNQYFVSSTSEEVFTLIDNDDTFIVFVGRDT